jgi:hypothetical protein
MATPGFFAQAAVYYSRTHYRSVTAGAPLDGWVRVFGEVTPLDQACNGAGVAQCITEAQNTLEQELADCNDLPNPQQATKCRVAARVRFNQAVAKCDPCPTGSRCDSNVCCPNDKATCAPPCSSGSEQTTFTGEVNIPVGALLYNSKSTYDLGTQALSNQILISQGKGSLISMQLGRSPSGGTTTSVDYGPMFSGVQHASYSSSDGVTFVGIIDGRQTVPFNANTDPRNITFLDGGALPTVGSNVPGLIDSLNALSKTLPNSVPSQCPQISKPPAQPPVTAPFPQTVVPAYHIRLGGPGGNACATCANDAAETLAECDAIAAAAVVAACLFPPACPAAAIAGGAALGGCATQFGIRMGTCELKECCPKRCGPTNILDLGSGCCEAGEQCVNQNDPNAARGGCCPEGRSVCSGNCCIDGETCVQGVCCPPNTPGACNGVCCSGPCDQAGNCCNPPNHLCGGFCCPPFNQCCNGHCCDLGQTCHPTLGTCCSVVCGPSCCANGQFCQDPVRGICGGCGPGQHACVNPKGVPPCCPNGTECCANGQCCPQGTCCCALQTGFECRPLSDVCCTPR